MKKICIPIIIISYSLLFLSGCSTSNQLSEGKNMIENAELKHRTIGPTTEATLENKIAGTKDLLNSALDSYHIMTELAASDSASKKGIKAATKVTKKYEKRLNELSSEDFSSYTMEELSALSEELSNIITAIRQARDVLNE